MRIKIDHILYVLLCCLFFGCGPKVPDGLPKLYPVTLTVTQDGKPLDKASVVLSGADKWVSVGTTDAQGVASFYTQGNYAGVPEGTFKVAVTRVLEEGEKPPRKPYDAESARVYQEYLKSGKTYKQFQTTPLPYRDVSTTPLTVEITKNEKTVTVNVEGTVKEEVRQRGPR